MLRSESRTATRRMHSGRFESPMPMVGVGKPPPAAFWPNCFRQEVQQARGRNLIFWSGPGRQPKRRQRGPRKDQTRGAETPARHSRRSRMAMDLARPGGQGTLQSTFCAAGDRAEGDSCRCPQACNQTLAPGGIHATCANRGCGARGPTGMPDSKERAASLNQRLPKKVPRDLTSSCQARMRKGLRS